MKTNTAKIELIANGSPVQLTEIHDEECVTLVFGCAPGLLSVYFTLSMALKHSASIQTIVLYDDGSGGMMSSPMFAAPGETVADNIELTKECTIVVEWRLLTVREGDPIRTGLPVGIRSRKIKFVWMSLPLSARSS